MTKKAIEEKIKNHIELRKPLWTILIVLTGSLMPLLFDLNNPIKLGLLILGVTLDVFIFNSICEHNKIIERLIKQLEEKNK